jgi:peptidoglycan/xylan/chitin deacetylase (PgdA/CDA1 family)
VTFDDAYRDNLEVALPNLERHGIPATFFVVSDALGRAREYWWDALGRAVLESGALPPVLEITLAGRERRFTIADGSAAAPEPTRWHADWQEPRNGREQLYMDLWNAIVALRAPEQEEAVASVLLWAGMPLTGPESRRPATREQVAALAGHPLVRIGNHTRHHPSLPDHDPARQRDEIAGCQQALTELTGGPIDRMSYPFGRHDASSRAIVAELGIPVACTSHPAAVTAGQARDVLPRLQVLDRDADGFGRWLHDDHALLGRAA